MPEKITHTRTDTTVTETMEKTPQEKGWDTRRQNQIAELKEQLAKVTVKNEALKKENRALKKENRELQG